MTAAFLEVASPATLASLIFDVEAIGKGAVLSHLNLSRQARAALIATVGAAEAEHLIEAAAIAAADRDRAQEAAELESRRTAGDHP